MIPIHFFTLALDAMPYLAHHLPTFNRLKCDWRWSIVHGVATNTNCTSWCQKIAPRLSTDGTTEYLESIRNHPRVDIYEREDWAGGKVEMCNEPLKWIERPCLLWQVDSDELWLPHQIEIINDAFYAHPKKNHALFYCRYFVGQNLHIITRGNYGNNPGEWARVWRYNPGMKFAKHEPPVIEGLELNPFCQDETEALGCVFDHYAYATDKQVAFKEQYYGYKGALRQWRKLQQLTRRLPAKLSEHQDWVKDGAMVDKVFK